MSIITSKANFRQRVIRYSEKKGVTAASIRFRCRRYNGSWKSLVEKSHKPHSHPRQHTEAEKKIERNKKVKPYKRAEYPGQKIQIDVKFVPLYCVANGRKYYQYTAIDECTRYVYWELYEEHSTHSSLDYLLKVIKAFTFAIREVHTDNGTERTKALLAKGPENRTLIENALMDIDKIYHRIRIATPWHNGKVERQHREDEKRFYKHMRMFSLKDGRKQHAKYNIRSNNIPKTCLNFASPNEVLEKYLAVM